SNVALEAFFAGEYDVRTENVAKLWNTAYDAAPVKDGRIIKEEIKHLRPQGVQGFLYNIRKPVFQDKAVREALAYAFDFEWSNKQFAYGGYKRTDSYFENSELAALDAAPTGRVLEILETYRGKIADEVFTARYQAPKTDGSGKIRKNLRTAMTLLDNAGYKLGKDGIRVNEKTGQRLEFEIIDSNPMFERWVLPFISNLKKIGVATNFRVLDPAQYQNRMNDFDYDMTIGSIPQSSSPGNEQRDFWASEKADMAGSRNYIGVKDPVIDDIIEKIIQAPDRAELVALTRALDRTLLSGHYLIPQWHIDHWRIAYWSKLDHPKNLSDLTPAIGDTWNRIMKTAIIIPARYGSTRFPGKPLTLIGGQSMLSRVVDVARKAAAHIDDVTLAVATEDQRIMDHANEIGVECIMTSDDCKTGSDRVLEALKKLGNDFDFVVGLQGDAPFTPPEAVEKLITAYKNNPDIEVVTPVINLRWSELDNLREQKKITPFSGTTAIINQQGNALWFSKNILPAIRKEENYRTNAFSPVHQHIGLYGYRVDILEKFVTLDEGYYEKLEGLEQLRLLENGISIQTIKLNVALGLAQAGIDSPEDVERAEKILTTEAQRSQS
ncbi:unnamed protein product, partial [Cyprideis torosa]